MHTKYATQHQRRLKGVLTLVLLATGSSLLLRGRLAVDVLLLGDTLARGLLRGRVGTLFAVLLLGGSSLLARSLLGSCWNGAVERGCHQLELDLGPGVAGGARVAHTGVGGELLVVDL